MRLTNHMRQTIGGTVLGILTVSLMASQYLFGSTTYTPPTVDATPLVTAADAEAMETLSEPADAYEMLRLHFTGSVVIGSMLGTQTHGTFNAAVSENGTKPWLAHCAKRFANDAMTFSLLDTVLTDNAALQTRSKTERVWYMAPTYHAKILENGGIDTVSVATSHSLDYGTDGLSDTIAALSEYSIAWGNGENAVYRTQNDVTIGVYPAVVRLTEPAETDEEDAPHVSYDATVLAWIENARTKCAWTAVYLTVDDMYPVTDDALIAFAELCADRGVDLVLLDIDPSGTPVVLEKGNAKIYYGLGAFLSGGERLTDERHGVLEVAIRTENGAIASWDTEVLTFVSDAAEPWILYAPDPFATE